MAIFIQPLSIYSRRPRFYDPFDGRICYHPTTVTPWMNPFSMIPTAPSKMPTAVPDSLKNENGKFEIKCSIPGFSRDELSLDLDGDKLILAGEKKDGNSFQRIERIFSIPSEVDKASLKCEFDPSLNQVCIEAATTTSSEAAKTIESSIPQNSIENQRAEDSVESMEESKNKESQSSPTPTSDSEESSKSEDTVSIKGKDYIERETDEGIEIDTTVSS